LGSTIESNAGVADADGEPLYEAWRWWQPTQGCTSSQVLTTPIFDEGLLISNFILFAAFAYAPGVGSF
jgi:hypothetical protein